MKVLAIITARKNSKRLRYKNRKILGKKPLVNWTIDFAKKIKIFKHILMTTDDEKIFKIAKIKIYWLLGLDLKNWLLKTPVLI